MKPLSRTSQPGLLEKALTLVVGALLLVAAFMFSLLILAVAIVVGLMVWGYFWWKTRKIRQAMREQPPGGHVIEGEVIVVDDLRDPAPTASPQNRPPPLR